MSLILIKSIFLNQRFFWSKKIYSCPRCIWGSKIKLLTLSLSSNYDYMVAALAGGGRGALKVWPALISILSNLNNIQAIAVKLSDFSYHLTGNIAVYQLLVDLTRRFYGNHLFKMCFYKMLVFVKRINLYFWQRFYAKTVTVQISSCCDILRNQKWRIFCNVMLFKCDFLWLRRVYH